MAATVTFRLVRYILNDPNTGTTIPTFQAEGLATATVEALFNQKAFDIGRTITITESRYLIFSGEATKFTQISVTAVVKAVRDQAEASNRERIAKESLAEEEKRETEQGWNLMLETAQTGHAAAVQTLRQATANLTQVQQRTGIAVQLTPHQTR